MPLANPIGDLHASYGVVMIGSGYGGAILAARLAEGRCGSLAAAGPGGQLHPR